MGKKRLTKYNPLWVKDQKYTDCKFEEWLGASEKGYSYAFCKICSLDLNIQNGGIQILKQHKGSKAHNDKATDDKPKSIASFYKKVTPGSSSSTSGEKRKTLEAELRWLLHTVETSKSFNCEDSASQLFKAMFPDSPIASKMTCGRTKQLYLLNFAVQDYVEKELKRSLLDKLYSIGYDEADGQLAIAIRYVNDEGNVTVDLLDLIPLSAFNASAVVKTVVSAIQSCGLLFSNWISDETDKCNTMRGCHKGAVVQVRKIDGLSHLIDVGGCSLHAVANANKTTAEDCFPNITALVDEIYYVFKYSLKKTLFMEQIQSDLGYRQLKFKRNVKTRWLYLLFCLRRIDEQWEPIKEFIASSIAASKKAVREKRIAECMTDPLTRPSIKFLINLFEISETFEKWFQQSESVLIHRLLDQLIDLLRNVLVRFVKEDAFQHTKVWRINVQDKEVHRPLKELIVGESMLSSLTEPDRMKFMIKVRLAFTTFASYLQKNLPFDFKVLKYLQFLGINKGIKVRENHVVELAKLLPPVIPATAINKLRTEVRLYNVLPKEQKPLPTLKTDAAWHFVRHIEDAEKQQTFPVLSKLAEGCCSIFHGNADVERYFGKKHDIDANSKRSLLSDDVRRNLLMTRSFMQSRNLTAANFAIPDKLLDKAFQARSEYAKYLANMDARKNAEKAQRRAELERMQDLQKLETDKVRKAALQKVEDSFKQNAQQVEEAARKRLEAEADIQKALQKLAEATETEEKQRKRADELHKQKERILKEASVKAMETVAKESATIKRRLEIFKSTGNSSTLPKIPKKNATLD